MAVGLEILALTALCYLRETVEFEVLKFFFFVVHVDQIQERKQSKIVTCAVHSNYGGTMPALFQKNVWVICFTRVL